MAKNAEQKSNDAKFLLSQLNLKAQCLEEVAAELTQYLTQLKVEELALLSLRESEDSSCVEVKIESFAQGNNVHGKSGDDDGSNQWRNSLKRSNEDSIEAGPSKKPHSVQSVDITRSCIDMILSNDDVDLDLDEFDQIVQENDEHVDAVSYVASVINRE